MKEWGISYLNIPQCLFECHFVTLFPRPRKTSFFYQIQQNRKKEEEKKEQFFRSHHIIIGLIKHICFARRTLSETKLMKIIILCHNMNLCYTELPLAKFDAPREAKHQTAHKRTLGNFRQHHVTRFSKFCSFDLFLKMSKECQREALTVSVYPNLSSAPDMCKPHSLFSARGCLTL